MLQRIQSQKCSVAEAPRLKLTEVVVEGALGAVLTDEAALDQGSTFRGRGADSGYTPAVQQAGFTVFTWSIINKLSACF